MSDSELSDWEKDSIEEFVAKYNAKTKTTDQPASAKKAAFVIPPELSQPLSNPEDERERIRLIEETRDLKMGGGMFGVNESDDEELRERSRALMARLAVQSGGNQAGGKRDEDPATLLERIPMQRLQDVEALCAALEPKISSSPAKSGTWLRLLDRLLARAAPKMDAQDLKTLNKRVYDFMKKAEVSKNEKLITGRKGQDHIKNPKSIRIQDELDMFGADDSEYSDDDVDVGLPPQKPASGSRGLLSPRSDNSKSSAKGVTQHISGQSASPAKPTPPPANHEDDFM